jgi:hypothetical protein
MSRLENPFKLTPATAAQFVGRSDILKRWQERLTPYSDVWNCTQNYLFKAAHEEKVYNNAYKNK